MLRTILEELLETDINEHPNCDCDGCKEIRGRISSALAQIKAEILACLPKEKDDYRDFQGTSLEQMDGQLIGFNEAITETLARIEGLFNQPTI